MVSFQEKMKNTEIVAHIAGLESCTRSRPSIPFHSVACCHPAQPDPFVTPGKEIVSKLKGYNAQKRSVKAAEVVVRQYWRGLRMENASRTPVAMQKNSESRVVNSEKREKGRRDMEASRSTRSPSPSRASHRATARQSRHHGELRHR